MPSPAVIAALEAEPGPWLHAMFRDYFVHPVTGAVSGFAPFHLDFWYYVWAIRHGSVPVVRGRRRSAYAALWPRSYAKTTNSQMACAAVAARRARNYGIYVSNKQALANQKVEGVATMLTSRRFRWWYPDVGARRINDYSKGAWRRDRIQTASGFTLDAFGLDASLRGSLVDRERPDFILLDDIDEEHDSSYVTQQKIETITRAILPAGQPGNTVVLFLQNVLIAGGVADQLAHDADWLTDRIVSGPHPAVRGLQMEGAEDEDGRVAWRITGGESTWEGRSLPDLEAELNKIGPAAFRVEMQHETRAMSPLVFPHFRPDRHRWARVRRETDPDGMVRLVPDLPRFVSFVGGLDWGGEGATAHPAAGVLLGITADGRYIMLEEFRDRGVQVDRRQIEWMLEVEEKWAKPRGRRVKWRGDASQTSHVNTLRSEMGFDINPSDRTEGPNAERRRSLLAARLQPPSVEAVVPPEQWPISAVPGLMYVARCRAFEGEMQRYRRELPKSDEEPSRREVLKIADDVVDATLYAVEEAETGVWRTDADLYAYAGMTI